jgi:hypothetical protein
MPHPSNTLRNGKKSQLSRRPTREEFLERYEEARAKINDALPLPTKDSHYTIWMVLHYKVNNLSATLTLNPDNGVTSSNQLVFGSNIGSQTNAISLIMDMHAAKDNICDRYSAKSVDDAISSKISIKLGELLND